MEERRDVRRCGRRPRIMRRAVGQFRCRRTFGGTIPGPREHRSNGEPIYEARFTAGFTQLRLAELLNVQQSDISAMEHSNAWLTPESAAYLADVLTKTATALGVNVSWTGSQFIQPGKPERTDDARSAKSL